MSRSFYETLLFLVWATIVVLLGIGLFMLAMEYSPNPHLSDAEIKAGENALSINLHNCTPGMIVTGLGSFSLILMIFRLPMRVEEPPTPPAGGGGGAGGGSGPPPHVRNIIGGTGNGPSEPMSDFGDIAAAAAAQTYSGNANVTLLSEVKAPLPVWFVSKLISANRR